MSETFSGLDLLRMSVSARVGVLACPLMPLMPDEWQQRHSIHPKVGAPEAGKGGTSFYSWSNLFTFRSSIAAPRLVVIGVFH